MPELDRVRSWFESQLAALEAWANEHVLAWATLVQLGVIVAALVIARAVVRPLERALVALQYKWRAPTLKRSTAAAVTVAFPALWLLFTWLGILMARSQALPHAVIALAATLLFVWIVVRLASRLIYDSRWTRLVAVLAWIVAALSVAGLLDPLLATLDRMAVSLGTLRISALTVLSGGLALAALLWIALLISRLFQSRLERSPTLAPSLRVLFVKLLKVLLVLLAVVVALGIVGIDLTAFAFMAGAIGVGVGFGLQKVVSNFVAGIILLLDRSIKPGDVIAVGNTFGWVTSLSARYTSLTTRDGIEHLIPNDVLIAERVENWSFSNNNVRIKIGFGISYDSDVHKARGIALEVARDTERVLVEPAPVCHLVRFGDNSVDFELRLWIRDPEHGVTNVLSAVRLALWDRFHAEGIAFPYPQRDLHLRSAATSLRVKIDRASD
jgi:small-conductance mechanosensitive channel